MIYPIYTELTECRDCYKCVRSCPVKAIQVRDGSAVVVKDRCIYCGACVDTCPSHAKKIRNDLGRVKQFLKSGRKVFCSLAPSVSSEFPNKVDSVVVALKRLGFFATSETAIGAALVNASIEAYASEHDGRCDWISTACPTVVQIVKKYYPGLVPSLSKVPSPLQCHSAYLRKLYGEDIGIVFIGPCIAKKIEADETPGFPDLALIFGELRTWLEEEHIDLDTITSELDVGEKTVPPFLPSAAGKSTLYPVEGGMIASLAWGNDPFQTNAVAISGSEQVVGTLAGMVGDNQNTDFLELLFCEGGCINGPGGASGRSSASKKGLASRYTRSRITAVQPTFAGDPTFVAELLKGGYSLIEKPGETGILVSSSPSLYQFGVLHSDEEIEQVLHLLGKADKLEELNCGGCGYNS